MKKIFLFSLIVLFAGALSSPQNISCPSGQWFSTVFSSCQPLNTIVVGTSFDLQQHLPQLSTPPSTATVSGYSSALGGPSTSYDSIIQDCASQFNVNPNLVKAVVRVESNFNPNAVSSAGAEGLMQLMPSTFNSLTSGDIFDPRTNICAGTKYLAQQLSTFNSNRDLTVAAYNAGPGAVKRFGNNIPNYPETQKYVVSVDAAYNSYSA